MADMTRAQMIDKVLQRLGVLGAGQSASAEDADLVGKTLDGIHSQYRKLRLAPFATSAFPDWAQEPYAKIIAAQVAPYFGKGDDMAVREDARKGHQELGEQLQGEALGAPVRAEYF